MINDMKLICFDVDGTLTQENSWEKLNTALGMSSEKDAELLQAYKNGNISYEVWQQEILASYTITDKPHKDIIEDIFAVPEIKPDAENSIKQLQAKGYTVVLISGSFDLYVQSISHMLGDLEFRACASLVFNESGYIQHIKHSGDEHTAKLRYLEEFAREYHLPVTECICVGDGCNDVDMFKATGKGITFIGSPIEDKAWKKVQSLSDIGNIL